MAAAGVLLAGAAWAQGPGGRPGEGPGFGERRPPFERAFGAEGAQGRFWNNPKIVERLKLTDEQRKAFDGILLEHREKLIDLRAGVEKAELEMEPLIGADQPDEGRILAQIDKVAQARAELEKANARYLLAIRGKLTPEQWKQVQAFRANHEQERGKWERGEPGRDGHAKDGQKFHGQWPDGQGGRFHRQLPPPQPPPPGAAGPQGKVGDGAGPDSSGAAGADGEK